MLGALLGACLGACLPRLAGAGLRPGFAGKCHHGPPKPQACTNTKGQGAPSRLEGADMCSDT